MRQRKILDPNNSLNKSLRGFAENKLRVLEDMAEKMNLYPISKAVQVQGITILLKVYKEYSKIIALGGGAAFKGDILFNQQNGAVWAYSVEDNLFYSAFNAVDLEGFPVEDGVLTEGINAHNHMSKDGYVGISTLVKDVVIEFKPLPEPALGATHIGNYTVDNVAVFTKDDEVIVGNRLGSKEAITRINSTLDNGRQTGIEWLDDYCRQMGQDFYLAAYRQNVWNLLSLFETWDTYPVSGTSYLGWVWYPNLFYAEAGNSFFLPGWYYGNFFGEWVDNGENNPLGNPSTYCDVTFNSILDGRYIGRLPYGYCETLVKMDDTTYNTIYFYLNSAPFFNPDNATFLYQSGAFNRETGTFLRGTNWSFQITPEFTAANGDYKVHWWNTADDRAGTHLYDYSVAVISSGQQAEVWMHTGALQRLYTTGDYHSHTVSSDGRYLAFFETEGVEIQTMRLFDLLRRDESLNAIPETPLVINGAIAGYSFLTGSYIPASIAADTELNVTHGEQSESGELIRHRQQYAIINYNDFDFQGMGLHKGICEDGVHFHTKYSVEYCFDDNHAVTIIAPTDVNVLSGQSQIQGQFNLTIENETYTGTWEELCATLPYVLSSSTSYPYLIHLCKWEGNENEFTIKAVLPDGLGEDVEEATLNGSGELYPLFALKRGFEEFGLGGIVTTINYDPPQNCDTVNSLEYVSIIEIDTCGHHKETTDTVGPATPASITGNRVATNGAFYSGSGGAGGAGSYSVTITTGSGLSINSSTGQVSVSSCGTGTVTYTTDCGDSASINVRWGSGFWCTTSDVDVPRPKYLVAGTCEILCETTNYQFAQNDLGWTRVTYYYRCCSPSTPTPSCGVPGVPITHTPTDCTTSYTAQYESRILTETFQCSAC